MQSIKTALLAGATALALTAAAPAMAAQPHVMTVQLPDGATARIAYDGDVPPQVVVAPALPPMFAADVAPSFAVLERMSESLDRQADALLREAATMAETPGARVFSTYEEITSNGACVRRTEITYGAGDATPRRISTTSGNCNERPPSQVRAPVPSPHRRPDLILAKAEGARPHVRPASGAGCAHACGAGNKSLFAAFASARDDSAVPD